MTTGGEYGGWKELATNGTNPTVASCEVDVGAAKDMAGTGAT